MQTAKTLHRTEIPRGGTLLQALSNLLSDLEIGWRAFRATRSRRKAAVPDLRTREIDALYRELRRLMVDSSGQPEEIKSTFARLRALQYEEVAEMREQFEASLTLSTADARDAIREARSLLGRDEDPIPANPSSVHQV
jgi:hypothetical protein